MPIPIRILCSARYRRNDESRKMIAISCAHQDSKKHGKDRRGRQRFRCKSCGKTFVPPRKRPLGDLRISIDKAELVIRLLIEGMGIRATQRVTGVNQNTIMALLVEVGTRCKSFSKKTIKGIPVNDVQADEIWGFCGMKQKTAARKNASIEYGDAYCYTAIERETKLLLAWHLGKRSDVDTHAFAWKLDDATSGTFQLSTDGYKPYQVAIPNTFGMRCHFGYLVKVFSNSNDEHRYSPGTVVETKKGVRLGNPDPTKICTSHVERANLSIRMHVRRMTRLTNAFSKKRQNHECALSLFFAYYNFCRIHQTIGTTPAVKSGLTDSVWSIRELLDRTATHY